MEWNRQQKEANKGYDGYGAQINDFDKPSIYNREYEREQPARSEAYYQQQYQSYSPPVGQINATQFAPLQVENGFAAFWCYSLFWLTGLLFFIFGHRDRFVRFHALQSLLFFGGANILFIFLVKIIDWHLFGVSGLAIFLFVILNIVAFIGWIVAMVNALKGRYYKLPLVGNIAEQVVNQGSHIK
ncbi:hypothetical protein EPA93_20485 [Ktedonosporobacter rubrisoli]|uniref:DUF4870 domain-containing protein n=1 Tax=Ktedonosporobacter rubrisoli TaxID=2509675 RepID=A0A4P6JRX3_KTERU|nr:hypothetical protein [Ktedonosporobacter rubrisoli]QBD78247.1 hypothetical protein EPA93_20485 [Ktedonosporobacter rubrisoli]